VPPWSTVHTPPYHGGIRKIFSNQGGHTMKKQQTVRKPSRKIADAGRIRFGNGSAPRVLRSTDKATADAGKVRFGNGSAPASLRR
jgi:hypothetical protein